MQARRALREDDDYLDAADAAIAADLEDPEAPSAPVAEAPNYVVYRDGCVRGVRGRPLVPTLVNGYECVTLSAPGRKMSRRVHRLVAAAFLPNPEGLPHVAHLDGNRRNNRAENLVWTTLSERRLALRLARAPAPPAAPAPQAPAPQAPQAPEAPFDEPLPRALLASYALEALEDDCCICMDARAAVVFLPCGHSGCCAACATTIGRCPSCRAAVASRHLTAA